MLARTLILLSLMAIVAGFGPAPAFGHAGEAHSDDKAAEKAAFSVADSIGGQPRASAASELFELVAVSAAGELLVYLDRYASNRAVRGASVELTVGEQIAVLKELSAGIYRLESWDPKPGTHDLVFTIIAGKDADLLETRLEIPDTSAETATSSGVAAGLLADIPFLPAAAGMVALLGGAGWLFGRGRRRRLAGAVSLVALIAAIASSAWA